MYACGRPARPQGSCRTGCGVLSEVPTARVQCCHSRQATLCLSCASGVRYVINYSSRRTVAATCYVNTGFATAVDAHDLPLLLPLALDPLVGGDLLELYHQLQLCSHTPVASVRALVRTSCCTRGYSRAVPLLPRMCMCMCMSGHRHTPAPSCQSRSCPSATPRPRSLAPPP